MNVNRAVALTAVALFIATASVGCSKISEPGKDAPVGARDDRPADVLNFPDGYSNVAAKCDGSNMVYVAFHGDGAYAGIDVVKDDPRCSHRG